MKILKIFFAMIIVFSFFSLYGCGGGKGGSNTPSYSIPYIPLDNNSSNNVTKKPWLFIIYSAADNSDILPWQLSNIDQLEKVGSDENTDIVAFIDIGDTKKKKIEGWEKWNWSKTLDWSGARSFHIQKDDVEYYINSPIIKKYGDVDSGSKTIFSQFLKETIVNYPAENICLVLNDHGGAFFGLMADDTSNTMMTNEEVAGAIKEIEDETDSRINVLAFDACLMANIESVYEYKDLTDYILASEEESYSGSFNYKTILNSEAPKSTSFSKDLRDGILPEAIKKVQNRYRKIEESNCSEDTYSKINPDITPKEFAQIIFDVNKENIKEESLLTYSLLDTSKFESLKEAIDDFVDAVMDTDQENLRAISSNLNNQYDEATNLKLEYGNIPGGVSSSYYVYDIYNMMDRILASNEITDSNVREKAGYVKESVKEAVIDNINSSKNALYSSSHGLSIFCADLANLSKLQNNSLETYEKLQFIQNSRWRSILKILKNGII